MFFADPSVIIDIAKRGLEKERELLMFRSLPGIPNENNHLIELDFSDSESDPNGNNKLGV